MDGAQKEKKNGAGDRLWVTMPRSGVSPSFSAPIKQTCHLPGGVLTGPLRRAAQRLGKVPLLGRTPRLALWALLRVADHRDLLPPL